VNSPILDTHQHLIYADRLRYTVAERVPVLAHRVFHYADYLEAIKDTGIEATVFMETSADDWEREFDVIYPLSKQPDTLITGIIAQCPPENSSAFQPWIERHIERGLVGIRRVCHTEPDEFSLQEGFVRNVRLLSSYQLTFDLCFLGRQLPYTIRLAQRCENTQMVLDHCGVPDIAHGEWDTWKASIRQIAKLPNVSCKVSGVLAYCQPEDATLETVKPYVETCIESFGWDRLVWGSDWPFCNQTTTLKNWVDVSRELVRGESLDNQRKLFSENARRIYQRLSRHSE
jgi:predicted TIM-barrel fold metal-dependent hydrolase